MVTCGYLERPKKRRITRRMNPKIPSQRGMPRMARTTRRIFRVLLNLTSLNPCLLSLLPLSTDSLASLTLFQRKNELKLKFVNSVSNPTLSYVSPLVTNPKASYSCYQYPRPQRDPEVALAQDESHMTARPYGRHDHIRSER